MKKIASIYTLRRFRFVAIVSTLMLATSLTLAPSTTFAEEEVPVILNDKGEDACGTARVKGLNPNGDGFLSVRNGPSTDHRRIDKLHNGDVLAYCGSRDGWAGIVYGGEGCTGGSPKAETQNGPYKGPCRSGWVSERYVEFLAG